MKKKKRKYVRRTHAEKVDAARRQQETRALDAVSDLIAHSDVLRRIATEAWTRGYRAGVNDATGTPTEDT